MAAASPELGETYQGADACLQALVKLGAFGG
jgi:hypothetical protein